MAENGVYIRRDLLKTIVQSCHHWFTWEEVISVEGVLTFSTQNDNILNIKFDDKILPIKSECPSSLDDDQQIPHNMTMNNSVKTESNLSAVQIPILHWKRLTLTNALLYWIFLLCRIVFRMKI